MYLFKIGILCYHLTLVFATLENECNALTKSHFYDIITNICHVFDGPKTFAEARNSCTDLPNGYLMVEHLKDHLKEIVNIFNGRNNSLKNVWTFPLSEPLQIGQTITFRGKVLSGYTQFAFNLMKGVDTFLLHLANRIGSGHHRATKITAWVEYGIASQKMTIGQDYIVEIDADATGYILTINGQNAGTVPYVEPIANVDNIVIYATSVKEMVIDAVTIKRHYGGQACTWVNMEPANRGPSDDADSGWVWTKDWGKNQLECSCQLDQLGQKQFRTKQHGGKRKLCMCEGCYWRVYEE